MEFKIMEILNCKGDYQLILQGISARRTYEYVVDLEPNTDERAQEILEEFKADARAASLKYHAYVEVVG